MEVVSSTKRRCRGLVAGGVPGLQRRRVAGAAGAVPEVRRLEAGLPARRRRRGVLLRRRRRGRRITWSDRR